MKFQGYIDAGDRLIRQHPDFGRIHDAPSDDYLTCGIDQIATILHALCDVPGAEQWGEGGTPESILDDALRCYQGDQEDREPDAVYDRPTS